MTLAVRRRRDRAGAGVRPGRRRPGRRARRRAALAGGPLPRWKRAEVLDTRGPRCSPSAATSSPRSSPGRRPSRSRRRGSRPSGPSARSSSPPPRRARWPATSSPLDAIPSGEGKVGFTMRVPIGVVGAISPFNFPLNLVAHKVAPAIAAGCPVVLKPASQTPFSAHRPRRAADRRLRAAGRVAARRHRRRLDRRQRHRRPRRHRPDHVHRVAGRRLGDPRPGAAQEGRPRARQQRPGDHRGRQRLAVGGGEDQGRPGSPTPGRAASRRSASSSTPTSPTSSSTPSSRRSRRSSSATRWTRRPTCRR